MSNHNPPAEYIRLTQAIRSAVDELSHPQSYQAVYHYSRHDTPMPSSEELHHLMNRLKSTMFPGYFGHSEVTPDNISYYMGSSIDQIARILMEQIKRGYCFSCIDEDRPDCIRCENRATEVTTCFISELPHIRQLLATDVNAAYLGDPASQSPGETIFCYPSLRAMLHYRIAHSLFSLQVPLIPRILTEMAHSETGIDIHPGATIDEGLFIDHGTGTVIGETCIIGKNVRIYQGVTLGAKSFPLSPDGHPIKGIPRHPIVEDNVTIYSGATILGRITIGQGAVIGGNVWITQDIPPGAKILKSQGSLPIS
ncbi:MAG: serine acetyltransferase [Candidatus Delongbacteria bacterium]|nr:serine acetyltransferase [Candidatus Delongbacteria bacterium]